MPDIWNNYLLQYPPWHEDYFGQRDFENRSHQFLPTLDDFAKIGTVCVCRCKFSNLFILCRAEDFRRLLEDPKLAFSSDLTFLIGDVEVKSHFAIVAARCDYLKNLVLENCPSEQEKKSYQLPIKSDQIDAFRLVLQYLYTDQIRLDPTQAFSPALIQVITKVLQFFTKFTFLKSYFCTKFTFWKSHFCTKFTFLKSYFSQNSHFQSLFFAQNSHFQSLIFHKNSHFSNIFQVLQLSIDFQLVKLEKLCIKYLEASVNVENVLETLKNAFSATSVSLVPIKEYCLKFIIKEAHYNR